MVEAGEAGLRLLTWPALDVGLDLAGGGSGTLVLSRNRGHLINGAGGTATLWRLSDGVAIAPITIEGRTPSTLWQLSPDATRLVGTVAYGARVYCRAPDDGFPLD